MTMQVQKYFLRQILRQGAVLQKVPSHAEDHRLMIPDQHGERLRVALDGLSQRLFWGLGRRDHVLRPISFTR